MINLSNIIKKINIKTGIYYIIKNFLKKFNKIIFKKGNLYSVIAYKNKKINTLFLSHIDVVSEGDIKKWNYFPFKLNKENKYIYARGICDMKSSIIAFLECIKNTKKNVAIIISSDEEKKSLTSKIIFNYIIKKQFLIKNCLVGEPTSKNTTLDTIRTSRRGSLNLELKIIGIGGHVAYDIKSKNPFNEIINLTKLIKKSRNKYNSINIINIKSKNKEFNVIPYFCKIYINVRFLKKNYVNFFLKKIINFKIKNNLNLEILVKQKILPYKSISNIFEKKILKIIPNLKIENFKGGASDGRFFSKISKSILEAGVRNKFIHKINENIKLKDFFFIKKIYKKLI
ncbi:M20/M25/M40 family metallo-hydrolase [Candidatus Vidania fulgoroideorum]